MTKNVTIASTEFDHAVELGELGPVAEHVAIAEELCAGGHLTRDRLGRYNPC